MREEPPLGAAFSWRSLGVVLRFRPLLAQDLPLLHEWLQRPHVRRWWGAKETYEEVAGHYLPSIEGSDPTDLYVALLDDEPIGFVQTYLVADYPEYAVLVGAEEGAAGVDLFIADEALTGRGIGSELLRRFTSEIVFARPGTSHCTADPDVDNRASVRAFEKAGFRTVRTFLDPEDGKLHALVRLDRG
jgi:RimJ/RimL family protein N-acetyltransferase